MLVQAEEAFPTTILGKFPLGRLMLSFAHIVALRGVVPVHTASVHTAPFL